MRKYLLSLVLPAMLLACAPSRSIAATPNFTISASSTTMSGSGSGAIPFALTSISGYTGKLSVSCAQPNVSAGTRLPYCGGGRAFEITLAANATVKSEVGLTATPVPLAPVASRLNLPGHGSRDAWAFAGVLLLGFGFRRRRIRWLSILLLSLVTLVGLSGLTACGGTPTLTPGTYAFTVTATDMANSATVSTTANVTVPPGIPTTAM